MTYEERKSLAARLAAESLAAAVGCDWRRAADMSAACMEVIKGGYERAVDDDGRSDTSSE